MRLHRRPERLFIVSRMLVTLVTLVTLAGVGCGVLPGCWSMHEAKGPRDAPERGRSTLTHAVLAPRAELPAPDPATMWPARDVAPAQSLLDQTPELILDFKVAPGFDPAKLTDEDREYLDDWSERVAHKGIYAGGLLRLVESKDPEAESKGLGALFASLFTGFAPNAYYISALDIEDPGLIDRTRLQLEETQQLQADGATSPTKAHSGGLRSAQTDEAILLDQGIALRLPAPVGPRPYRGVLIRMAALAGNEYEQKVVAELERRGWAVVHIETRTTARPYATPAALEKARELDAVYTRLQRELREAYAAKPGAGPAEWFKAFDSSRKDPRTDEAARARASAMQLRSGVYQWPPEVSEDAIAATIAERFDQSLAENAYAAEAALEYLARNRPDVPQRPLVIVGFSAGAIATPTVAARLGDRVDAAVLIGGGANALDIALRSELVKRGVPVERAGVELPRHELLGLREPYLAASRLDPYHTARLVRTRKLLMLHGIHDTWVPASSGELLYERLDRPQRLIMSGGHELLFYFLPDKAAFIADWLEEATAERSGGVAK